MVEAQTAPDVTLEEFNHYADAMKEYAKTKEFGNLNKDQKLQVYSLGKQGQEGDNTTAKPGMLAIKEKYKWEAWNKLKGMDQQLAKNQFVALAKTYLPKQ